MNSPNTGKAMTEKCRMETMRYRDEEFVVLYEYWQCDAYPEEQYTTPEQDDRTLRRVWEAYRQKHPDAITPDLLSE